MFRERGEAVAIFNIVFECVRMMNGVIIVMNDGYNFSDTRQGEVMD